MRRVNELELRPAAIVIGCGDVGIRVARGLQGRSRLLALTSTPDRMGILRSAGITPLPGNLDQPATLARLSGLATRIVHLAPPPGEGNAPWWRDLRTGALLRALRRRSPPAAETPAKLGPVKRQG